MTQAVARSRWHEVRDYARRATDRFADLVAAVPDPAAMATADWSVAETAAHTADISSLLASSVYADRGRHAMPGLAALVRATTVDTVATLNEAMLNHARDRSPAGSVARLRREVDDALRATADRDPDEAVPWLGGSRVPLAGLMAHLVNEVHLHGWDIARAARLPWRIPPTEAARFFDVFLVGITRAGQGDILDSEAPPPARPIAVEFRSAYTAPVTLLLRGGRVSVEPPGGAVDARVRFHPPTLTLMLFGRVSKLRAALTGGVRVGGPRPWLLAPFLRTVRMPAATRPRGGDPTGG